MIRVVLDVMGGDYAPEKVIKGALLSLRCFKNLELILVGKREVLEKVEGEERITCVYAEEVIEMDEPPGEALKKKKNSSILKGIGLLKEGKGDAFVSAGNSGAIAGAALLVLGRIKNLRRPAIAIVLPSLKDPFVFLDVGAVSDCKPQDLYQFGVMGSIFFEKIWKVKNPRIALLSIGEEIGKGNQLVKKAYEYFKNSNLNYIGNVEGRELYAGKADVIVTDGFTGNVCLKLSEGLAETIISLLKREVKHSPVSILGMLLATPALRRFKKKSDWREYGGAPLLGVKGNVIIAHGRSDEIAIKNAIKQAMKFVSADLVKKLEEGLEERAISL